MTRFEQQLSAQLQARHEQGLYRHRKVVESAQGTEIVVDGNNYLSFCSNDYLGLAKHPDIIASFMTALQTYGAGSGASHLITGHSTAHQLLETELAEFTGRSRALVFSSGYMANVGVISALLGPNDAVFEDRLNHASLLEGGVFSGAKFKRYHHLDSAHLATSIEKSSTKGQSMIVSDGVFSMDGDQAPLAELIAIAEHNQAILMIDDAHGFGCVGDNGGGIVESCQKAGVDINEENLPILIGTFGKAFGTGGAFVAGSETLIETLIQYCKPYIYTTAMPPALAEATRCSLRILQQESWRRSHLLDLITTFRKHCLALGFTMTDSITPIQSIIFGDVERTVTAGKLLQEQGIMVLPIRPPTVPPGSSRLRFTFSAAHSSKQLSTLLEAVSSIAHLNQGQDINGNP